MVEQLRQIHESLRADIEVLEQASVPPGDETSDGSALPDMIAGLTIVDFV